MANREIGKTFALPKTKLLSGRVIGGCFAVRMSENGCNGCCFDTANRYFGRKCAMSEKERRAYVGDCKGKIIKRK